MAFTTNFFGRAETISDIEETYEYLTSPENITADGECGPAEQRERMKRINADKEARLRELGMGWYLTA